MAVLLCREAPGDAPKMNLFGMQAMEYEGPGNIEEPRKGPGGLGLALR